MNISSIVVQTSSDCMEEVISGINCIDKCEVHFYDSSGKIVVTIEGDSIGEQMDIMKRVQLIPSVLSANVAYSYCEDELKQSVEEIEARPPGYTPD